MNKEEIISAELKKLKKLFKNLDKNKKDVAQSLMENAAFMSASLKELQDFINKNGYVEKYQNGENQWGMKKSAAVDTYNNLYKNYITTFKQLIELLPKEDQNNGKDEFLEYLKAKK